jgi:hypothetical protein
VTTGIGKEDIGVLEMGTEFARDFVALEMSAEKSKTLRRSDEHLKMRRVQAEVGHLGFKLRANG